MLSFLLKLAGKRFAAAGFVFAALFLCPTMAWAQTKNGKDLVRADEAVTSRAALVIGNTNYEYKPLKNPKNDAQAMADALTKLGFKVTLKYDLTLIEMRQVANAWADSLDGHTLALVYYSGHGVTNEGQNYLVPVNNAQITHKRDVPYLAFPFKSLLDATKDAGCPLRIFILDACRNDPLPKSLKGEEGQGGLVKVAAPTGAFIAYAAASGETASDNKDGNNGLYTAALLKNITTPGLLIENLFKRVLGEVRRASGDEQHPDVSSQLEGDFCFAGTINGGGSAPVSKEASAKEFTGRGDEFYGEEKYEQAAAYYTIAIDTDSKNASALSGRGAAYFQLKQFDKALADSNEAIRLKPDFADGYVSRGLAREGLQYHDKAISDYNEALRLKPGYARVYNNRGVCYNSLSQFDKAVADFDEAIRLKLSHAFPYANRGLAYAGLKKFDNALADYTEAIRRKPDFADAYFNRGNVYSVSRQFDKALADYSEVIHIKPDYFLAYHNRGIDYFGLNQFDKAIIDYNEVIRLKPDFAEAYSNRGGAYDRLKQFDKALVDYNEAIRLKPDLPIAYLNRGIVYDHLNQFDKALADYRHRLQLSPNDVPDWLPKRIAELEAKVK